MSFLSLYPLNSDYNQGPLYPCIPRTQYCAWHTEGQITELNLTHLQF